MINRMKSYSKINYKTFDEENFELQPYMTNLQLTQARQKFRLRSFTTRLVKMNFPSDKGFTSDLWSCWHCPSIDTQDHIMNCPAYKDLRKDKNLSNDRDLISYFQDVIKLREKMMDK